MNTNLFSILVVSGLSLHAFAERNSDRGSRWSSGQNNAERTYTAPTQQTAPQRTYTPSQTVRSEPARVRTDPVTLPQQPATPSRNTFQNARAEPEHTARISTERTSRERTAPSVTQTQPVVQPTQPVTITRQPTTPSRNTFQDVRGESERTARASTERTSRERTPTSVTQTQPVVQPTQPVTTPRQPTTPSRNTFQDVRGESERTARASTERTSRERITPSVTQTQPVVQPTQPVTTPRQPTTTARARNTFQDVRTEPERTARVSERASRETRTQPREPSRTVQIAPPRTDRRSTERESSPLVYPDRSASRRERSEESTRTPGMQTSPIRQAQHQAVSLRSPQHVVETRHPTYNNSYYEHHYPQQHERPEMRYSNHSAFWRTFGFTLGASLFAPLYIAPVIYPARSYYSTTWYGGPVAVSVSSWSPYPAYAYRPYYCHTGYIHSGWHYSSAYYGGWRGNWYGGFSYIFNPTPVYSSYYLYDEPQTIVVQQPAPQVVYVNPPALPAEPPQESILETAPFTTQPQPALEPATTAQTPPADENTRCFCACKCNGRVPCICEYACGSEFAYSPADYTLKGFASYAESLNTELIWSSYAGLDRAEPEALVAGAAEQ